MTNVGVLLNNALGHIVDLEEDPDKELSCKYMSIVSILLHNLPSALEIYVSRRFMKAYAPSFEGCKTVLLMLNPKTLFYTLLS